MRAIWQLFRATFAGWSEDKAPRLGLGMIKDRFASFTMVIGIAFLLLVSLILSTALAAFGTMRSPAPGLPPS